MRRGADHPLLAVLAVVAVLCAGIVSVRLRASWWACGPGAHYLGVRAVAFDFDGTVADSMGTLAKLAAELLPVEVAMPPDKATNRYLATAGDDFRTQLDVIADGYPCLDEIAASFEAAKESSLQDADRSRTPRRPSSGSGAPTSPPSFAAAHALNSSKSFADSTG